MSTGSRWVCQYASASRSPPAFEAEYGFEGRRGSPSRDAPRSTEPYTSSVEMWTRRGILRSLTASSSVWTPKTSVRKNSSGARRRSEEHTSELQSPCNLVCRLLLEKKKRTADQQQRKLRPRT